MITKDGLFDQLVSFDEDHHSGKQDTLIIKREQEIPDEYVSGLKREKIDTLHTPTGDLYRVASIPVVIVDKWAREGFYLQEHTAQEILARLRKDQMDAFITTTKRI